MNIEEIDDIMYDAVKHGELVSVVLKTGEKLRGLANYYSGCDDTESGYSEFVVDSGDKLTLVGAEEIEDIEIL